MISSVSFRIKNGLGRNCDGWSRGGHHHLRVHARTADPDRRGSGFHHSLAAQGPEAAAEHDDPGAQRRPCLYQQGCPVVHDWHCPGRVRVALL